MENDLRLSVIIPTYETRELTLRCLAALWLCNPQPDEVIVVDNGSTDNTAHSVLRKYPRHVVVRLPENQGFSAAANHGVTRASGDLLLLLNSDTEVGTDAVTVVRDAFARDPHLGIAGAALRHFDGAPQWSGGRMPNWLWCFALASGLPAFLARLRPWRKITPPSGFRSGKIDWVAGTAMVIRREVWEQVGPFDLQRGGTISKGGGVVEGAHPELLWTDLLRLAYKRRGMEGARYSNLALQMGGRLRLLGRRMASPLVPESRKPDWRAVTSTYTDALRAFERITDSGSPAAR
jgi:cellulose synthase/poly-beta-1,6-N-acetylglucosamine synthase-like glycosyltransferase